MLGVKWIHVSKKDHREQHPYNHKYVVYIEMYNYASTWNAIEKARSFWSYYAIGD